MMVRNKKKNQYELNDNDEKVSNTADNEVQENKSENSQNDSPDAVSKKDNSENGQKDSKQPDEEIDKLKKEIETLTDTMKRRQADFENYKKRMVKTQEEQKKMIIKDFAQDVIDINDDLLRAMEATCNVTPDQTVTEVCNSFADGFLMISKRIEETLNKYGIEEIESIDKPFDPNFNEAVEIDESSDVEVDTVTKVHQKGFHLDDFVIRAAKVKVTKAKKIPENDESESGSQPENTEVEDINAEPSN